MTKQAKYHPRAPWPCMRGDHRNTGYRPSVDPSAAEGVGETTVRHFKTGNGVFSTPVIGPGELIYIGSGDHNFYALDPLQGEERWRFRTGEVIDSAAAIGDDGTLYVPSCDASIYALAGDGAQRWRLDMLKDRQLFSPSTIYWWEANIVIGPNGLLYAPSDDFYLYAIEPSGEVRWGSMTGLNIWTAPAFGDDGAVYVVSLDTHAYAFDQQDGSLRWRSPTGNFVASSPAVGSDGTIYFGSFDKHVYALAPADGAIRWRFETGGQIYATAAIAPDDTLYVGSSDGLLYALAGADGHEIWTYYTGDAIRGSAALGPDPEGRVPYLIYFGGGNGLLYALEPSGKRRWSYDTRVADPDVDYPNINASIALGDIGLAAAAASGDVIWVPYDYYRRDPRPGGVCRDADDGYPAEGISWYTVSPGGVLGDAPLTSGAEVTLSPGQPLSLRAIRREAGQTVPAIVDREESTTSVEPNAAHRTTVQADTAQLNVIFDDARGGDGVEVATRTTLRATGGAAAHSELALKVGVATDGVDPQPITSLLDRPFSITQMAIYSPSIVVSFDQIGIASLTIDVGVIHTDAQRNRFVAWGVKKFGTTESGEAVGVPVARHLLFGFAGSYDRGSLVLESGPCRFELTAFPVPLDRLRFSGSLSSGGLPEIGPTMLAELRLRGIEEWIKANLGGAETPEGEESPIRALHRALVASKRAVSGAADAIGRAVDYARSWFPRLSSAGPLVVARSLGMTLPLARLLTVGRMYEPWGLFDASGRFSGVGTFTPRAYDRPRPTGIALESLAFDSTWRRVIARWSCDESCDPVVVPAIALIDREGRPIPCDYNEVTVTDRDDRCRPKQTVLDVPLAASIEGVKAVALLDVFPQQTISLGPGGAREA